MPHKFRDVEKFFIKIAKLEVRVERLMAFQKWEMTLLAGIILLLVKVALSR